MIVDLGSATLDNYEEKYEVSLDDVLLQARDPLVYK